MLRGGFIEMQIEEIGRVMARILAAIAGKQLEAPIAESVKMLAESGVDLETLLALEVQEFVPTVSSLPGFTPENIEAFANVLFALGQQTSDTELYQKSLCLLRQVDAVGRIFSLDR